MNKTKTTQQIAAEVSGVSIAGNLLLSVLKLIAGLIASSTAMISDAVHSASDVFSTLIVMIGVRLAGKDADKNHPYGHERMECVAAIVLAVVLAVTGGGIGYSAMQKIVSGTYKDMVIPGGLALVAAILSMMVKEGMFWYTRHYAKQIDSNALMADAWHHRSDALSSVGAFIGIGGAMLGYPIMEPLASILICIMILKAAYEIFMGSIDQMVDHACDEETEKEIRQSILQHKEVRRIDLLQTRVFGNRIYVDLEIAVADELRVGEAHRIAEEVHDRLENQFPKIKHIMVHVNPENSDHIAQFHLRNN